MRRLAIAVILGAAFAVAVVLVLKWVISLWSWTA